MLQVLVLDDDSNDRDRLEQAFHAAFHGKLEYRLSSLSRSTDAMVLKQRFDVYFLDIDLPDIDGISVAKAIRQSYPESVLVFVTRHENLVFQTFEVSPFHFIRKDVFEKDFKTFVDLFEKKLQNPQYYFSFRFQNDIINVKLGDILYFEKLRNDLFMYTTDQMYRFRENLSFVEMQISRPEFVRIHHSYLVNLEHVRKLTDNIELWNGVVLPVSRTKAKEVRERYLAYLKGKV